MVLDITNPAEPQQLSVKDNQKIEVVLNNNSLSRFIIIDKNSIHSINEIEYNPGIVFNILRNTNTTADYIIIGPENYSSAAQPILELRSPSIYASLENIYREFSSGNKDPMAIRIILTVDTRKMDRPQAYTFTASWRRRI